MTNLSPTLRAAGSSANLVRASALAALLALLQGCSTETNTDPATAPDLHQVTRGDLRVTVSEDGEIQAFQETRVRSQMEGRVRIKYLIEEGSQVTAGQRLVELDSSDIVNQRASQAIAVAKAEASFTQAQENNRILAKELEATENAAESKLIIARMELEKFLGRVNPVEETALGGNDDSQGTNLEMVQKLRALIEGDPISGPLYKGLVAKTLELLEISGDEATGGALHRDMGELSNKVLQQVDRIRLAQADLKIKEETRNYSRELHGKSFITKNELDRDELSYESQKSNVTLAWNDLDLLINYTLFKEKLELFQGVTNSDLELAQVKASNSARLAKENADLESAKAERDLAKERLENYEQQIKNATITAPNPGIVVYAVVGDGRRSDPISSESEIRENQDIILLPDTTKMVADLKVQEADRDKVLPGQTAMITTDQGLSFPGKVARVAPLPDSGSRWSNNDRKVYKTRVEIQADNSSGVLRPNMSCKVEIIISHVPDVLSVPTPAVLRQGRVHYVWKQVGGVPVATKVTIGAVSQSSVEIKEGLEEGDVVYKAPPEGFEAPRFEQPEGMQLAPAEGITAPDPAARAAAEAAAAAPMTEEERAALMEEVRTFLIAEYPDREEEFAGDSRSWMRLLFTDQDMKARIENHPDLGPKYERYTSEMMNRFRQGGGGRGNRTPGEGGGRTPGEGGGRGGRNRGGNSGGDESGGGETGGRRQGGRGPGGGGQ